MRVAVHDGASVHQHAACMMFGDVTLLYDGAPDDDNDAFLMTSCSSRIRRPAQVSWKNAAPQPSCGSINCLPSIISYG
jgi:hypothetical protein